MISALIDKRLLVSVSHKAPLRLGFPIDVVEREEFINAGVILSCPKLDLLGARIEAAMNNGTATPDMVPEDVRRAQEESARREIAAQTQLAPPPALSKDPPSRAEARAALVDDFMSLATDGLAACQPLRSGTPDPVDFKSGASRDEIAELLAVKRSEFATGCTQSGDGDAPAEAYFKRQRDSVRRVVPPS